MRWFTEWKKRLSINWRRDFLNIYRSHLRFLDNEIPKGMIVRRGLVRQWMTERSSCAKQVRKLEQEIEGIENAK